MSDDLKSRSLTIAPGVIETIVALSIAEIEGVAMVGTKQIPSGILFSPGRKGVIPGVEVYEIDDQVVVDAHVQVFYGYRLADIAESIRAAVSDALESQVNIEVSSVNVTIDAIQFSK